MLHLTEDGGICVCCRAGPDFKPTAENDRQALSAGFTLMGNSGLLPKLAMLDVAKKDLGGPFEGTVIHVFRSQWRIKGGNSKKEVQTLPLSGTYYLFFFLSFLVFIFCLFVFLWDSAGVNVGSRADGAGAEVGTNPPAPLNSAAPKKTRRAGISPHSSHSSDS